MNPRLVALSLAFAPPALVGLAGLVRAEPVRLGRPSPSASASAPRARPRHLAVGFAPDPPPLVTRGKWIYQVSFFDGAFSVPAPTRRELPRPTATERRMGRFMLELYVGPDLLERVRFDVPLLNGDPWAGAKRRPFDAPPDLTRHVRAKIRVEVPDTERATSAAIVDRATGESTPVPWPRAAPAPPSSSAAPAPPSSSAAPVASSR